MWFHPSYHLAGLILCPWMGVYPQSRSGARTPCRHCSSTCRLAGAPQPLNMGYLLTVTPALCRITQPPLLAPTSNSEEAEIEWFYEDLQSPSRTKIQKRCPFHCRGLECKSRKSRNTQSNRQIWPWSTEWSRAKANGVLPREHTGHSKHPLPTTQEKILHMDITRWSTPKSDWLYSLQPQMKKLYTVNKNRTGSWLRSWTPYCQIQAYIEESRENH